MGEIRLEWACGCVERWTIGREPTPEEAVMQAREPNCAPERCGYCNGTRRCPNRRSEVAAYALAASLEETAEAQKPKPRRPRRQSFLEEA